ncbi:MULTISPECIES: hypothetical protein [Streptomyces]|uniref:Uncharacterized protein n=1 Tax=Streptomyces siderophoricus TaxID=2802281 RepID=A0ABS1MM56_9ACTN|nr:hypothetical protein [Streptomyces sp. 9-7]MBL1088845.1 hypothetical protein [Streptomyces sp. 9-7]
MTRYENDENYDDEQPAPLYSLPEEGDREEENAPLADRQQSEDRDLHYEEWRAHDRSGPYGQRRRRRN